MAVTAAAKKTVSGKSPYTGDTFQELADNLLGRSGLISGGVTTDDGANITVQPFKVALLGLIAEVETATGAIAVPTSSEPWFLLASIPDDDPATGVLISVTTSLAAAASGVVIAFKINGSWQNPRPIDIRGASLGAPEIGVENGFDTELGVDGSGLLNQLDIAVGQLVDPDDTRRVIPPEVGESAKVGSVLPTTPHEGFVRNDVVVLRQRESFSPEIKVLRGPPQSSLAPFTEGISLATGAGVTRPHYYARPGGTIGQQWWAWGDGSALKIIGGPAGEAFAALTLLSGGSTINSTWIAGQRASDDAVILIYLDGTAVRVVSFNPATGAQIDAPVTIDTEPNAIVRPRGAMDTLEKLHVVYEHDEGAGPPSQQIYYTKVETATATFGTHAVTPRIVNGGAVTGKNDTWASIAVDRYGVAHVAYTTGTGANEYGDLVHAVIDATGVTELPVNTFLVGSDVAEDAGTGFVNKIYDDFRRASVAVTPHDEVFIALLGSPNGGTAVDDLLLFSPTFKERLGYDIILLDQQVDTLDDCAITANDHGGLHIFTFHDFTGAGVIYNFTSYTIDTVPAPRGRLAGTILRDNTFIVTAFGAPVDDVSIALGPMGEVVHTYQVGTSAGAWRTPAVGIIGSTRYTTHPKDVALKTYQVREDASGVVPVTDGDFGSTFEIFNTRPKKMNYPILVGNEGDYQGYRAIEEAVAVANRVGGDVVLRAGRHLATASFELAGGVTLRGDGAYLDMATHANFSQIVIGSQFTGSGLVITGNKVETTSSFTTVKPGDFIELTGAGGTGFHRVAKVFQSGAGLSTILLVDDAYGATTGTPPGGTTIAIYPTGVNIENLTIFAGVTSGSGAFIIQERRGYNNRFRDLVFAGSHSNVSNNPGAPIGLGTTKSIMPVVDGVDFSEFNAPDDHFAVDLGGVSGTVVRPLLRNFRMRDGGPAIMVRATCVDPVLESIIGDGGDDAAQHVEIETGFAGRIHMVNVEGRISGGISELLLTRTHVGRRIRMPEHNQSGDDKALEIEDANTRAAAGITDDAIKLTSTTHKEFNGATADVITQAVNERVLKAGDTMTGALNMENNINFSGGSNIRHTDDSGCSIGESGSEFEEGRFKDLYATNFLNTLDLAVNQDVTTNLIPAVAGQNLGAGGLGWDLFVNELWSNIDPDAADTRILGPTNRFDLIRSRTLALTNTGATGVDLNDTILDVRGATDQVGPLIRARGLLGGERWVINPHGYPERFGPVFEEEFMDDFNPADANSPWLSASAGVTSTWEYCRFLTTAVDNNTQDLELKEAIRVVDVLGGFTVHFRPWDDFFAGNVNRMDKFGWDEAINVFHVQRDTDVSNNWIVHYRTTDNIDRTYDTGVSTIVQGAWNYLSLYMLDTTSFVFRIGSDVLWQASDDIVVLDPIAGTGLFDASAGVDQEFHITCATRHASAKELHVAYLQISGQQHPSIK